MAESKRFPYAPGVAEAFSFLDIFDKTHPDVFAGFVGRVPGVPTSTDKAEVLESLKQHHWQAAADLGFDEAHLAEQVHGNELALITRNSPRMSMNVDGLLTKDPEICLGIHVADCGALYLVDRKTGALGLLHSGKKGTELNITERAIQTMQDEFGTNPSDLTAILAPCIRPPHYELDFAAMIKRQALSAGLKKEHYHDCGICTSDLERFYSYRLEKGNTGRMIALLGRRSS